MTRQDQFLKEFKVKLSNKNSEKQPPALLGMIVHNGAEDWHKDNKKGPGGFKRSSTFLPKVR
jgi:hypothetical protein